MVNPGAFRGSRKEFLLSKKSEYNQAVIGNYVADAVAKIQRQYLKRYPIDLPHNQEPDAAFLQAVDDDAPDPEPEEPNAETMSASEYKAAIEKSEARKASLNWRKKQIKRWLAYQYIKDNDVRSKESGAYMPYTTLMKKLTGKDCVRPRLKTPTNVWRKTQRDLIEEHLKGQIELERRLGKTIPPTQYAAIRDKIARELFAELDEGVRREWRAKAAAEHKVALQKYQEEINDDPSMEPADLQMAIQGMVQFTQPLLDMLAAVTGWKVSLLAGGPEPAQGGRLSVISIHSGYTSGDIKMTYGRAERARYKKHVIPSFGSFLKLCYTPEECRARALPEDEGYMPMSAYENDTDETTYHAVEPDTPNDHMATAPENAAVQPQRKASSVNPTTSATPPSTEDRHDPPPAPISPSDCSTTASPEDRNDLPPAPIGPAISSTSTSSDDEATAPIPPTGPSMTTDNNYTTQDSMPCYANPFPFDDLDDDDEAEGLLSHAASPLPSAPPSPLCSRSASPSLMSSASQHLGNAARMTDAVVVPIVTEPANALPTNKATLEPSVTTLAAAVVTPPEHPSISSSIVVESRVTATAVAAPHPSIHPRDPPTSNIVSEPSALTSSAAPLSPIDNCSTARDTSKARKRKSSPKSGTTPVSTAEPASKRPRTKTLRAIASEEQNPTRKKRDTGKKATGRQAGGKENFTSSIAQTKPSGNKKHV